MPAKKSTQSTDLIATMEEQFAKAPPIPKNIVDTLVNIAPWLALIFGILGLIAAIPAIGILGVASPFMFLGGEGRAGMFGLFAGIILLVQSIMKLMAFKKLQDRNIGGWNLMFWSEVLDVVSSVISFSIGGIVISILAFYLLFQMKPRYK